MGMAICFKCGSAKSGALVACRGCGAAPQTDNEYAASLALSEHVSSKEQLTQYSHELRNGERLSVPRQALAEALDALKDPQLLAMLRAQSPAPLRRHLLRCRLDTARPYHQRPLDERLRLHQRTRAALPPRRYISRRSHSWESQRAMTADASLNWQKRSLWRWITTYARRPGLI